MKFIAFPLVAIALASCSSKGVVGSNCTDEAITILDSRHQTSASEVIEPLIYTNDVRRHVITVGRYDAYQILTERSKQNAQVARAVSLLRPFLAQAENVGRPIDSAAIYPDLSQLQGSALADAALVRHEVMVLFSQALSQGKARVGTPDSRPLPMTIQRYKATVSGGSLRGVRAISGSDLIYDYCGVTPGGT